MYKNDNYPFLKGALAGGLATICMSLFMLGSKKLGIQGEHPPKRIAESVLALAGSERPRQEGLKLNASAVVAHLGFGMVSGGAFGLLQRKSRSKKTELLKGIGYGLLIWTVSYKGWIPALNILPPPERDKPGRVKSMIAAHVIYGAVLAALTPVESGKNIFASR